VEQRSDERKEWAMKTLILLGLLAVAGLLVDAAPAQAQYPLAPRMSPTHYYGYPVAPYLNNTSIGRNAVGGPYSEVRSSVYNPATGYYITFARGYSYPYGFYTGVYRGFGSPGPGTYSMQYTPTYYSPSFFRPNYGNVSAYLPTY
jgi:hypothetical protein